MMSLWKITFGFWRWAVCNCFFPALQKIIADEKTHWSLFSLKKFLRIYSKTSSIPQYSQFSLSSALGKTVRFTEQITFTNEYSSRCFASIQGDFFRHEDVNTETGVTTRLSFLVALPFSMRVSRGVSWSKPKRNLQYFIEKRSLTCLLVCCWWPVCGLGLQLVTCKMGSDSPHLVAHTNRNNINNLI